MANKNNKKEFVIAWTEEKKAVIEARNIAEAMKKFSRNEIKREAVFERKNFRIEEL